MRDMAVVVILDRCPVDCPGGNWGGSRLFRPFTYRSPARDASIERGLASRPVRRKGLGFADGLGFARVLFRHMFRYDVDDIIWSENATNNAHANT